MADLHTFLHPRGWRPAKGFSNGVVAKGRTVFLAGQVGWNAEQRFESGDFVTQARQALANIVTLVQEAGGKASHITRLTWFVLDKQEYLSRLRELGEAYRSVIGKHFPAMTLVQVGALVENEAKLEIGDAISIEEGLVGVVLARYTRSRDARNDVHYIVELRREAEAR